MSTIPLRRLWPGIRSTEKLLKLGPAALTEAELLAILLQTGTAGRSALDTAHGLLGEFRSLRGLLSAERVVVSHARLRRRGTRCCKRRSNWPVGVRDAGRRVSQSKARDFLKARLQTDLRSFAACSSTIATGSSLLMKYSRHDRRCQRAPRDVVKLALSRNAAAVILAHNHPSGIAEPSQADEVITGRLRDALALVDIRVLDHIVVGDGACVSFAERGLL
jgi:DNA repair protein RadC